MRSALLEGPIAPQMARLSLPILIVLTLNAFVGVAETWFVSFLGTNALAGVALVFPVFMLMLMMSNGGIGGGVASAIARAIGAGRLQDANAILMHAVVIALIFGALFTSIVWLWGPALFMRLGGSGKSLAAATLYANLVFLSAIPGWIATLLAAALRGSGNVWIPALITVAGSCVTLLLSPLFILGWGPIPRFGVAGAGIALTCLNVVSALVLAVYLRRSGSPIRLVWAKLEIRLFSEILRVGLPSAAGTVISNATVMIATGLVGTFGHKAIAAYGLASRLDYLLIPLLFAIGTATVTMVGTNLGAGQYRRARRIAWVAVFSSTGLAGIVGFVAVVFPQAWIGNFTTDHKVIDIGVAYLVHVAPFYALFGAGMALYFASQGVGKMSWPFVATIARLLVVLILGGYLIKSLHSSLDDLYITIALSYLFFGAINLISMVPGFGWGLTEAQDTAVEMCK